MNEIELANKLKGYAEILEDESVEKIEFDSLKDALKKAATNLVQLEGTKKLCERLLCDFKSELKRLANFLSFAKGDSSTLNLVENLLSSENLDFDDLILLRKKLKAEFDSAFPSRPLSRVVEKIDDQGKDIFESKIGEFRVGGRL